MEKIIKNKQFKTVLCVTLMCILILSICAICFLGEIDSSAYASASYSNYSGDDIVLSYSEYYSCPSFAYSNYDDVLTHYDNYSVMYDSGRALPLTIKLVGIISEVDSTIPLSSQSLFSNYADSVVDIDFSIDLYTTNSDALYFSVPNSHYTYTFDEAGWIVFYNEIEDIILDIYGYEYSTIGTYNFYCAIALCYETVVDIVSNSVSFSYTVTSSDLDFDFVPPIVEGYSFAGWYLDSTYTTPLTTDYVVTGDTNLYAKYTIDTYVITFIIDDVSVGTESLIYGSTFGDIVSTFVSEGNTLDGWYLDGETTTLSSDYLFTSDTTLYASWDIIKCTITLWYDGEAYYDFEVDWGSTLTLPDSYSDLSLANESGDVVDVSSLSANASQMNFTIVNADYDDSDDSATDDDTGSDLSDWWDGLVEFLSPYSTYIYVAIVLVVVALVAAIIYRIAK